MMIFQDYVKKVLLKAFTAWVQDTNTKHDKLTMNNRTTYVRISIIPVIQILDETNSTRNKFSSSITPSIESSSDLWQLT